MRWRWLNGLTSGAVTGLLGQYEKRTPPLSSLCWTSRMHFPRSELSPRSFVKLDVTPSPSSPSNQSAFMECKLGQHLGRASCCSCTHSGSAASVTGCIDVHREVQLLCMRDGRRAGWRRSNNLQGQDRKYYYRNHPYKDLSFLSLSFVKPGIEFSWWNRFRSKLPRQRHPG
jgi:hypothetical protein